MVKDGPVLAQLLHLIEECNELAKTIKKEDHTIQLKGKGHLSLAALLAAGQTVEDLYQKQADSLLLKKNLEQTAAMAVKAEPSAATPSG